MKELTEFANRIAYAQADGKGIQGLGRLLMEKIGKTVIMTDNYGLVLSWHSPLKHDIKMEEKITLPSIVQNIDEAPMSGMTVISGKKFNFLIWPINKDKVMGYLLILQSELLDHQKNFVNIICRAAMIEMVRKQELYDSIKVYKDDFIRDILFNNYDGFDTALRAGKVWGWDFSLPYVVIVLDIRSDEQDVDHIRLHLENKTGNISANCVIGKVGKSLVMLYPVTERIQNRWKPEVRKMYEEIAKDLNETQFTIGVGKLYPSTNMLYRSYQQAKVALELGELSKSTGVSFFDELGAVRLFYNQSQQELEEFIDEILGPIFIYEDGKENSLLLTLWHYFRADTNIALATKNLYIHVNTLRYRLKKVEELLGKSLDDTETKFNVYGALKVAAMLGKL